MTGAVLGTAIFAPVAANAESTKAPGERYTGVQGSSARQENPDEQLDSIIDALDGLPEELKNADPATYPNYEAELEAALGGLTTVDASTVGGVSPQGVGSCIAEIAVVVVTYGVLATKVLKWLKEAKALWGGVKGILNAIKSGVAATELGGEGVALLEAILGVGAVKEACFG